VLEGSWEEFSLTRLPRAKKSRSKRRQLNKIGAVRLEIAQDPGAVRRNYAAMVEQKTRRYVDTRGVDGFNRPGYRAYFREMTDRFARDGYVVVAALRCGEKTVATIWGIAAARRFYFILPTFEAGDWKKFSPGRLMMEDLIAWCYGQNIRILDFGTGDEAYKEEFRAEVIPLLHANIPNTQRGRVFLWIVGVRRMLVASPFGQSLKQTRATLGRRLNRGRVRRSLTLS